MDEAYARFMKVLLDRAATILRCNARSGNASRAPQWTAERRIPRDKYEFQLLYGMRRDLQQSLVANGSLVRIYIPFGREWFPYFMRRLGERPANVRSVVRSIVDERAARRS